MRPPTRFAALTALTCALLVALGVGVAHAQDREPTPHQRGDLDVAAIASHIRGLEGLALPETESEEARSHYLEAQAELRRTEQLVAQTSEFESAAEDAPSTLAAVNSQLTEAKAAKPVELEATSELQAAERDAAEATSALQESRAEVTRLNDASEHRSARRVEIPGLVADARSALARSAELLLEFEGQASKVHPVVHEARMLHVLARQRRLRAEITHLEAELASYDARRDVLQARLDLAQLRESQLEALANRWADRVASLRQQAADAAKERAAEQRNEALALSPNLAEIAAENVALAARRAGEEGTVARLEDFQARLAERRRQIDELRESFELVYSQIEAAGLAKALGRLLHEELNRSLDAGTLVAEADRWREEAANAQYERIQVRQRRRELGNLEARVADALLADPEGQRAELRPLTRELLGTQRDLVEQLSHDYAVLSGRLADLARSCEELALATEEYRGFLEERILWLRSSNGIRGLNAGDVWAGVLYFRDGGNWALALERSWEQFKAGWYWVLLWLVGAVGIGIGFPFARRQLEQAASAAWGDEDSPWLAPSCLGWVALRAAPAPWLLLGAAGFLLAPPRQLLVAKSLGTGLLSIALVLYTGGIVFVLAAPKGIGALFRWRAAPRKALRRNLLWYLPLLAASAFVVVSMERQSRTELADSLGLLAFSVEALATCAMLAVSLRPGGPLLNNLWQRRPDGLTFRLRWVWFPAVAVLPLVLLGLALEGYTYSGIQLMHRLGMTVLLVTGVLLLRVTLKRWITLARLRHAKRVAERARHEQEQARKEREAENAQAQDPEGHDDESQDSPREVAEEVAEGDAKPEVLDKGSYLPDAEVRQLLRWGLAIVLLVGGYAIWANALPALRQLDRVQVYPSFTILEVQQPELNALVAGAPQGETAPARDAPPARETSQEGDGSAASSSSGDPSPPGMPKLESSDSAGVVGEEALPDRLTVADLGLAFLLLVVTVVFAKNLPALLQMGLLERLPLDPGVGYAISTGARYLIGFMGLSVVVKTLGIGWENIQWLAAALTFGLAFGLQEIFANFVSGVIILLERPIRVGDVVTVGQTGGAPVSGTVTRVRMRATTVTDWDNKELIIPNKEFVIGQVINWSLSSPEVRLCLPVGIAYGSDTAQARDILLAAAREHPLVLDKPEPVAFFDAFGNSTLNFELRAFVKHVKHRHTVRHELLERINTRFNEAKISIAFPQQDVHLHPTPELSAVLAKKSEGQQVEAEAESEAETEAEAEAEAEAEFEAEAEAEAEAEVTARER